MNKKRIYISGKITGLSLQDYLKNFSDAEKMLYKVGWESVLNPAKIQHMMPLDTTYDQYMQMSMLELSFCDAIYMLSNWQDSAGAVKEHAYALEHGYTVLYEGEGGDD